MEPKQQPLSNTGNPYAVSKTTKKATHVENNMHPQAMVNPPSITPELPTPTECASSNSNEVLAATAMLSSSVKSYIWNHGTRELLEDGMGNPISVDSYLGTTPIRSDLSTRPGPGGRKLTYMSGDVVTRTLNEAFGHSGWSFSVVSTTLQHTINLSETATSAATTVSKTHAAPSTNSSNKAPKWQVTYVAHVRISLVGTPGCFREDYGVGDSIDKHLPTAIGNAVKASITDGMKRAARLLGDKLGNSLYGSGFALNKAPNTFAQALQDFHKQQIDLQRQLHSKGPKGSGNPQEKQPHPALPMKRERDKMQPSSEATSNFTSAPNKCTAQRDQMCQTGQGTSLSKAYHAGPAINTNRSATPPFPAQEKSHPPRVSDVAPTPRSESEAQHKHKQQRHIPVIDQQQREATSAPAAPTSMTKKRNAAEMVTPCASVVEPKTTGYALRGEISQQGSEYGKASRSTGLSEGRTVPSVQANEMLKGSEQRLESSCFTNKPPSRHLSMVRPSSARVSDADSRLPQTAAQSMQTIFGGCDSAYSDLLDDNLSSDPMMFWEQRPPTAAGQRCDNTKKQRVAPVVATTNPYHH
ncbi:hypothetical protein ACA910_004384 [Epithemia clementina (nom. ined.)]